MLAGDLANPAEEALGGRAATAIGADAAGPRSEVILVILAHRHRCRRSMQKHNKTTHSAAKSCANIDVSQRAGTAPRFGRCRAPPSNQCADHDIFARWPWTVPSALILPSALPTSPPSCCRCSQNHRSKICTPDRSQRSSWRTAGSPCDEQRCAAQRVARMPIMWRFEPGEIGNRTCAQTTVGLRPICG
jgi:hypothetical protein